VRRSAVSPADAPRKRANTVRHAAGGGDGESALPPWSALSTPRQRQPRRATGGPTTHRVYEGDARDLSFIESESVHLVLTSPPYAMLKEYPDHPGQLGNMASYEGFLDELDRVWQECLRILVPGGRVACVVGDVCISRKQGGRHHVLPLSADIQVRARHLGFDNLTPIRWLKVANIKLEASRSSRFLGKPNLPNGIIKNDLEHILLLRKPGGYRSPTDDQQKRSFISTEEYAKLFAPVWTDVTGQLRRDHPAPFPVEVPRRLIRMFSFVGDTVVDPFGGTGTTAVAAIEAGRNSVSVEIDPTYVDIIDRRLREGNVTAAVQVNRRNGRSEDHWRQAELI
jgi:site-specific DNA-methyltransferase (adenine-specific)